MKKNWSRKEVYEAVWKEPVSIIAARFEVSDVGLAKACRRSAIPVPPRGYWARLRAGQTPERPPLPPPPDGRPDRLFFGRDTSLVVAPHSPSQDDDEDDELPGEPPAFPDDLVERTERAGQQVRRVGVPSLRKRIHPAIASIVKREEERRGQGSPRWDPYNPPLVESRWEMRRLRLLNALFLAFERLGLHPEVGRSGRPTEVSVLVDETRVPLMLEPPRVFRRRYRSYAISNPLELRIASEWKPDEAHGIWEERKLPLEKQLRDIVIAVLVAGETLRRERELERYKLKLELVELRKQQERDRLEAVEKARVEELFADARAFRVANEIREYVGAVRARDREKCSPETESWASWALTKAAAIDPILSLREGQDRRRSPRSPWAIRQPECAIRDERASLVSRASQLQGP
ncbi:MAG: hypothetical protein KC482_01365 [Dehalococcoidia bacterium]|nr:hypothetical protein [Dehalococcoidia bacterium]